MATMSIESQSPTSSGTSVVSVKGASFNQVPKACLSESVARSFLQTESEKHTLGGSLCTGNIRVLLTTAALFGTITIAQAFAAQVANSEALMADCVAMAVDVLTYFLHICVELRKGKSMHRQLQIVGPIISIAILVYFTSKVMAQAGATIIKPEEDAEEVNAWIVGGFAVWGIIFDSLAMWAFIRNAKKESQQHEDSLCTDEPHPSLESGGGSERLVRKSGSSTETHMMAAFMHVGADWLVAITTLVAALLIEFLDLDGPLTDAWACMVVGGVILVGACATIVEVVKDFKEKGCAPNVDA